MKLLTLDLASVSGLAYGEAGSSVKPFVDHWDIRASHIDLVPGNLAYNLRMLFKERGVPDFMAIEQALSPNVKFGKKQKTNSKTIVHQQRLHGAALGVAGMYRIPKILEVPPSTIRCHFIGQASMGDSASTKAAVFARAKLLGYPVTTLDEADAVALFDYISYAVLRKPPGPLVLT